MQLQEQVGESLSDYRSVFIYQLYVYRNNGSYYDPAYPRSYWVQYFEQKQMTIESMCLTYFCKTFTVGRGRQNSNKITPYSSNHRVVTSILSLWDSIS